MTLVSDAGPSETTSPILDPTAPPLTGVAFVVAATRTILTYLLVGLYIVIAGPPAVLAAFLFQWSDPLYVLSHGGVRLGLALSGIRVRLSGGGNIPRGRTAVFCANHVSNVDPPILFVVLHPRLHMLFKAEFLKVPILGRGALLAGFIPIERNNPQQSREAIDRAAESLRAGHSFLFYPEGTRSRTGALLPFKKGGFVMAVKAQVPIVPVAVSGGRAAMAKGRFVIRPVTVDVRIGRPIDTTGLTIDDRDQLAGEARSRIEGMLRQEPG